jgi:hypothetical protein
MDVTLDLGPQGIVFSYTDTSVDETGVTFCLFFVWPNYHICMLFNSLSSMLEWKGQLITTISSLRYPTLLLGVGVRLSISRSLIACMPTLSE